MGTSPQKEEHDMSDECVLIPGRVPHPGQEHMWDKWYPQDRTHIHRVCLIPECHATEIMEMI